MSFSDFEQGTPSVPFCQRQKKQQNAQADADDMLEMFQESERRLNILRIISGDQHEPTDEEIRRWISTVSPKQP